MLQRQLQQRLRGGELPLLLRTKAEAVILPLLVQFRYAGRSNTAQLDLLLDSSTAGDSQLRLDRQLQQHRRDLFELF
ncbi:hypothetical protein [Pseudonocardia sp. ICBG1142]|uniref:hypothetical protein n=1 Tax=Pseudonocardia sp. ICBG1142 TaxID=2846760 RepID=UPI001CF6E767|nr:hypothetical protein [Pseudonocardia sp. ICBG1142]